MCRFLSPDTGIHIILYVRLVLLAGRLMDLKRFPNQSKCKRNNITIIPHRMRSSCATVCVPKYCSILAFFASKLCETISIVDRRQFIKNSNAVSCNVSCHCVCHVFKKCYGIPRLFQDDQLKPLQSSGKRVSWPGSEVFLFSTYNVSFHVDECHPKFFSRTSIPFLPLSKFNYKSSRLFFFQTTHHII